MFATSGGTMLRGQYILSHTRLMALFQDYPGEPVPEKVKPIWILL